MLLTRLLPSAALFLSAVWAQPSYTPTNTTGVEGDGSGPDENGKYTISAEGIRMQFIPYGASISNLFMNDTHGVERDIVLGFDNASWYGVDTLHPYLGPVPGRYANRIKNSSFEIDGVTYHVLPNENNGADTLHGGPDGWSWRNWTVTAQTTDSITFSLIDPAGTQGFPGEVICYVTYTATPHEWHIRMVAWATTQATPIMLSSHTYWNLDAFQNPDTDLALNHTLYMPYSGTRVGVDSILIPNGTILPNQQGTANDFWSAPKTLGEGFQQPGIDGNCGAGCNGFDTCYITEREGYGPYNWRQAPVVTLASAFTGIQIDVFTDQDAFQIYSCNGQNGTLALKETQGLFNDSSRPRVVNQYGCIVLEVEDWIDGINQPEWKRDAKQIFRPGGDPYVLQATYNFSLNKTLAATFNQTSNRR